MQDRGPDEGPAGAGFISDMSPETLSETMKSMEGIRSLLDLL